jgi:hypothetical protein
VNATPGITVQPLQFGAAFITLGAEFGDFRVKRLIEHAYGKGEFEATMKGDSMKKLIAIAAMAGLIAMTGCASRGNQGGTSENEAATGTQPSTTDNTGGTSGSMNTTTNSTGSNGSSYQGGTSTNSTDTTSGSSSSQSDSSGNSSDNSNNSGK